VFERQSTYLAQQPGESAALRRALDRTQPLVDLLIEIFAWIARFQGAAPPS
jgi:hypothetical protein